MEADVATAAGQPGKPRRRLRWYQLSLRTLLVVVLVASLGMSWFAVRMQRARKQREVVAAIVEMGGRVTYDYEFDASGHYIPHPEPPGPAWLRKLLGDDFFTDVRSVRFLGTHVKAAELIHLKGLTRLQRLYLSDTQVTDADLEHLKGLTNLHTLCLDGTRVTDAGLECLKGLTQLQRLDLWATGVTDAGLEHLKGLTNLQSLCLEGTQVTDAGVNNLKKALPNCTISQ